MKGQSPLEALKMQCHLFGQKDAAKRLGFSAQYINDVIHERREMSEQLGDALGYKLRKQWIRK